MSKQDNILEAKAQSLLNSAWKSGQIRSLLIDELLKVMSKPDAAKFLENYSKGGLSPLHLAASLGSPQLYASVREAILTLVEQPEEQRSLLASLLALKGNDDMPVLMTAILLLLPIEEQQISETSPKHLDVKNSPVIQLLIALMRDGASPHQTDANGRNALELAASLPGALSKSLAGVFLEFMLARSSDNPASATSAITKASAATILPSFSNSTAKTVDADNRGAALVETIKNGGLKK